MLPAALPPPTEATARINLTTVSEFVPNPPPNPDPLAKERRRRLMELTKEAFPDGEVPGPRGLASVRLWDATANRRMK